MTMYFGTLAFFFHFVGGGAGVLHLRRVLHGAFATRRLVYHLSAALVANERFERMSGGRTTYLLLYSAALLRQDRAGLNFIRSNIARRGRSRLFLAAAPLAAAAVVFGFALARFFVFEFLIRILKGLRLSAFFWFSATLLFSVCYFRGGWSGICRSERLREQGREVGLL